MFGLQLHYLKVFGSSHQKLLGFWLLGVANDAKKDAADKKSMSCEISLRFVDKKDQ